MWAMWNLKKKNHQEDIVDISYELNLSGRHRHPESCWGAENRARVGSTTNSYINVKSKVNFYQQNIEIPYCISNLWFLSFIEIMAFIMDN